MPVSFTTQVLKLSVVCYVDVKDMKKGYNRVLRYLQNVVVTSATVLIFYEKLMMLTKD
jgi:hypothetical protein